MTSPLYLNHNHNQNQYPYRERGLLAGEIENFRKDVEYIEAKRDYIIAMAGGPPSDKICRRLANAADRAKKTIEANQLLTALS